MKITELKEKYDGFKSINANADFPFNQHINIKEYIPIAMKIDVAQKAAAEVYTEEDGVRSYDPIVSGIILQLTVVSLYTDLEYSEEDTFDAYDALVEIGFFDYLRDMDYVDIFRFRSIYEQTIDQIVTQYNSLPNVVNRSMQRLEDRLVGAIEKFTDKANVSPEEIEQLKESLKSINSTMYRVKDVKAAEVAEALKR